MGRPVLTRPQETADFFKIHIMTLWRWRQQEGFPQPLERGRVILYDIDKIMDWLEEDANKNRKAKLQK